MAAGARGRVVANQLDPVQGLEPEEHRGHGVAGLVLLLGELGQPESLAAQRVLGLAVDARGVVERSLDEGAQIGIGDEIGGGAQQVLGLAQAGAGWDQLLVTLARSQPARQGIVQLAAGSQMRAALTEPARERRPAARRTSCASSTVGREGSLPRAQEPFLHQGVDQFLDFGIRERGSIQRPAGRDAVGADLNQGREQPIELRSSRSSAAARRPMAPPRRPMRVVGGEGEVRLA